MRHQRFIRYVVGGIASKKSALEGTVYCRRFPVDILREAHRDLKERLNLSRSSNVK